MGRDNAIDYPGSEYEDLLIDETRAAAGCSRSDIHFCSQLSNMSKVRPTGTPIRSKGRREDHAPKDQDQVEFFDECESDQKSRLGSPYSLRCFEA